MLPGAVVIKMRKASIDGVGDEIARDFAVAAPFAMSFTTIRARTPSALSGFAFVTHRRGVAFVLCFLQKARASSSKMHLPAFTSVRPLSSFCIAANVPLGVFQAGVRHRRGCFHKRTCVPQRSTSFESCDELPSKAIELDI